MSTATGRNSADRRFKIWRPTFYRALGVQLERNRQYEICGSIDTIGRFKIHHVRSDKPYVFLSIRRRDAHSLQLGTRYKLTIESVKKRTDYNATEVSGRCVFRIPKARLEAAVSTSDIASGPLIIELTWINSSKSEPERRSFFTYSTGSNARIHLDKTGTTPGDVLRLVKLRSYTTAEFVRDFEAYKDGALANVKLAQNLKGVDMVVDGVRFQLSNLRMTAFGLNVVLTGRIEPTTKEIRFKFDGSRVDPRFFVDKQVRWMKASKEGLEVAYHSGPADERLFHVHLDRFDKSVLFNRLKLVSFPSGGVGHYVAEVPEGFAKYVRSRLASSSGTFRWSREKGDISEEVISEALVASGLWEEVARHPYDQGSWRLYESNKPGPDSVQRLTGNLQLNYFGFKWWERFQREALRDARRQVHHDLLSHPYFWKAEVTAGFIAVLKWDTRSTQMDIYVEQVPQSKG